MSELEPQFSKEAYQQKAIERFDDRLAKGKRRLEDVYTGEKRASDHDYANLARRVLREGATELFSMQIFPMARVEEKRDPNRPHDQQILDETVFELQTQTGHKLYLDLDGNLLTQYGTTSIVDDTDGVIGDAHLSRNMLTRLNDDRYRVFAGDAIHALKNHARLHVGEIAPAKLILKASDLFIAPQLA